MAAYGGAQRRNSRGAGPGKQESSPPHKASKLEAPRAASVEAPVEQATQQADKEQFVWTKQWYPIAVAEYLETDRPHPRVLLGKDLVLWKDGTGHWQCFEDRCPHRQAPLSEGRIEADGTLLCSYHAWRFDGKGTCTSLPQAASRQDEARQVARKKACAVAYPTKEREGVIYVWPDANSPNEAESTEPFVTPEVLDPALKDRCVTPPWSERILPYAADYFFENVTDPAHVNVSHHGLVGSRYDPVGDSHLTLKPTREMTCDGGFGFSTRRGAAVDPSLTKEDNGGTTEFTPPATVTIRNEADDGTKTILVLMAVPTRPGECRHIGRQVLIKNEEGKLGQGLAFFALPMPHWVLHATAPLFLHQDALHLHKQQALVQRTMRARAGDAAAPLEEDPVASGDWGAGMYLPNEADKGVVALRKWLSKYSGGFIPYEGYHKDATLTTANSDEAVFDTWHAHTKDCKVCRDAHRRLNKAQPVLKALAVLAVATGAMFGARPDAALIANTMPTAFVVGCAVAGALTVASDVCFKLQSLMEKYEFKHADNN
ncbi:unnamed protein product [Pedinophyceae sp. YPF-701]|nr:unnamed protein product [Pedinophyceae sp. YPF-701]